MTNTVLVSVCVISAGATLGTGVLSGAAHFGNREDDYYLPYALTCLAGTVVFLALAALYAATTLAEACTALRWHVAGVALTLPPMVRLFACVSRRPAARSEMPVLLAGSGLLLVANAFAPASLHFASLAAVRSPAGGLDLTGHGGWASAVFHLWMLVPIGLCFVNGRHVWRHGDRLLGGTAVAWALILAVADAVGARADFLGGRPAYLIGVPAPFLGIAVLGLTLGVVQRRRRLALLARESELRAANAQLREALDGRELLERRLGQAQRLEALGRMAAGVAHDFNNVLTVAGGSAELLRMKFPADSAEGQRADAIVDAVARGAGLTRQLLAFARRQDLAPDDVDVDRTIGGMRELLSSILGAGTKLVLDLHAWGHTIVADPTQFARVIVNLAVNARDAMPADGQFAITTEWIEPGAARPCACEGAIDHGHVLLAVSDTGCGIDPAVLPRIFEPFFTTKGPDEGTGLGLATVHGIVRQSGGYITVTSQPGEGTTFRSCWPGGHRRATREPAAEVDAAVRPA